MVKHGAPLQPHVVVISDKDLSFSPFQNHVCCMVFYPCMLLLQCVLTCKTCHASSSLGVVLAALAVIALVALGVLVILVILVVLVLIVTRVD
jgi:hypothetical protein